MLSQTRASSMALDRRYQLTVASGLPLGCSSLAGAVGFLTVTGRASTTQSPDIKIKADGFNAIVGFINLNTFRKFRCRELLCIEANLLLWIKTNCIKPNVQAVYEWNENTYVSDLIANVQIVKSTVKTRSKNQDTIKIKNK